MPEIVSTPPLPGGTTGLQRRNHTSKRVRIYSGNWAGDLETHLREYFNPLRSTVIGKPDTSKNLAKTIIEQSCALYSSKPSITNSVDWSELDKIIDNSGWWSMAAGMQELTETCRETFVRPTWSNLTGGLVYRIVTPDFVHAESSPDNPHVPNFLIEARPRIVESKEMWTWDIFDIRDKDLPSFMIVMPPTSSNKEPVDITDLFYENGAELGDSYSYRYADGTPFIPYATFHAALKGKLFDPYENQELFTGTLSVGVLWTYWFHNVRDSAWAQRYTIDASLRGGNNESTGVTAHQAVQTMPGSVMQFRSDGTGTAVASQWNPPVEPKHLAEAIVLFEAGVFATQGFGPNDYVRNPSPESGYAISLKREAVREKQRSLAPVFRFGDMELLQKSAAIFNLATGSSSPENGYEIVYKSLPRTAQEISSDIDDFTKRISSGLASPVDAYIHLNPGVSREEAYRALKTIADETRQFGTGN